MNYNQIIYKNLKSDYKYQNKNKIKMKRINIENKQKYLKYHKIIAMMTKKLNEQKILKKKLNYQNKHLN